MAEKKQSNRTQAAEEAPTAENTVENTTETTSAETGADPATTTDSAAETAENTEEPTADSAENTTETPNEDNSGVDEKTLTDAPNDGSDYETEADRPSEQPDGTQYRLKIALALAPEGAIFTKSTQKNGAIYAYGKPGAPSRLTLPANVVEGSYYFFEFIR